MIEEGPPVQGPSNPASDRFGRLLALLCIATCSTWAVWPLGDPSPSIIPGRHNGTPPLAPPPRDRLDTAAFHAPLWVSAPAPPAPPPAPPPPPPLRLQLLAIIHESGGYKALVFDPDADKLLSLAEGGSAGTRRVTRVTATSMDIRDDAGIRTLALRDAAGRDSP